MLNQLIIFLNKRLNRYSSQNNRGFTLIELLVAIVISSIIMGTLLSFVNGITSTERQEQAKATTEHEIQAALDYIANDLQEAVYIYDATGIAAIKNQLPNPDATDRVPVLVFWKRTFRSQASKIDSSTNNTIGCLVKIPGASSGTQVCDNRDYFVYSLVTYYLIKNTDSSSLWSKHSARVGRFEIKDGIKDPYNSNATLVSPDSGFQLFDLTLSGTLKEKMNGWKKAAGNYTNPTSTLVDYINQSTGTGVPELQICTTVSPAAQRVPADGTAANPLNIYSFYACVDSSRTLARVFLRGNALARMNQSASYTPNQSVYFPLASVQVKGRGLIAGE